MKIIGIYKITSPSNRVYIGQSADCVRREWFYKTGNCKNQPRLYYSINKYGWDKHTFEILCQCDKEQLDELERYYIAFFNSFNSESGLNLQSGGQKRYILTDEQRKKRSERMKGNTINKGRKHTDEVRKIISKARIGNKNRLGHKHTDEDRLKISRSLMGNKYRLGIKHTKEAREKMSKSQRERRNKQNNSKY